MIRLLDSEWERIREHFPEENIPDGRPGRKPVPTRLVLEAVLWILNTGAQWHMLPQCYPNYKTVHRRFQTWCRNEILRQVLTDIANELRKRGALTNRSSSLSARMRSVGVDLVSVVMSVSVGDWLCQSESIRRDGAAAADDGRWARR
jgi:transposase